MLQPSLGPNLIWVPESPAPPLPTVRFAFGFCTARIFFAMALQSSYSLKNARCYSRDLPSTLKHCERRVTASLLTPIDYDYDRKPDDK